MKKILLVDADSKIPNIALMKLSTYWKKHGYKIDFMKLGLSFYKDTKNPIIVDAKGYRKVFVSIVFDNNRNSVKVINAKGQVRFGGAGYNIKSKLPKRIDAIAEDYSLYPDNDISYGFITRGCVKNCDFCIVRQKEGRLKRYRKIEDIQKHEKVYFLDNNILAYSKCNDVLRELIDKKIKCRFIQGLDIAFIDNEKAKLLSELRYDMSYIFAFDNIKDLKMIKRKLKILRKYLGDWKIKFFLYCHPRMSLKKDIMFRINFCRENKILPYIMRDKACYKSEYDFFFKDIAAWCNQPSLFKKKSFLQFLKMRHKNPKRIKYSKGVYDEIQN